jgi:phospholipid N-methyltransferase
MKRYSIAAAALFAAGLFATPVQAQDIDKLKTGGPYVPTPQVVVDQMLKLGAVTEKDYVIDLGSGDGVIVLTAARSFKAGGMGIDIDPDLVKQSNASAQKFGIADRVRFVQQDVFKADLSKASVLTLYLLPGMMMNLRSKIFTELKPGVRVISHDYHFGDWSPDDSVGFDVPEKEMVTGVPRATVYKWIVPAKVAGKWEIKVAGGETYEMTLKQRFQNITEASAGANGRFIRPQSMSLKGSDISFVLPDGKNVSRFNGRVNGEAMEGMVDLPNGKGMAKWTAVRTAEAKVVME